MVKEEFDVLGNLELDFGILINEPFDKLKTFVLNVSE
jgi:hypothetical protein